MDMLENMRAFVAVAKTGSFTAAAQALDLATSVVTKRVSQLERSVGTVLLHRTTRRVTLSADGEYHLGRITATISIHDETLAAIRIGQQRLEGTVRIKVPTTLGIVRLNRLIRLFLNQHSGIDVEVLLLDGPLNPATEGIDIAITAFPTSFDGVAEEILWPLRRSLVAAPGYLAQHSAPRHPRELERHQCVSYQPSGTSWPFLGKTGVTTVTVRPRLSSNDMLLLLEAIKEGMGIGLLSNYITSRDIESGTLVSVLPEFPIPDGWVRAMVPVERLQLPRVAALLAFLRSEGGDEQRRPQRRRA
jgi:DNA-binding transcriptional LysR family regulator